MLKGRCRIGNVHDPKKQDETERERKGKSMNVGNYKIENVKDGENIEKNLYTYKRKKK